MSARLCCASSALPAGSGLQSLDSHGSINSATGLRAATSADMTDSDAAADMAKAHDCGAADSHLLNSASRLAVWLMVRAWWA